MPAERVHFRLIQMQCCGQMLCWVNPRFPNHCPECGKQVFPNVKTWVIGESTSATLRYSEAEISATGGKGKK